MPTKTLYDFEGGPQGIRSIRAPLFTFFSRNITMCFISAGVTLRSSKKKDSQRKKTKKLIKNASHTHILKKKEYLPRPLFLSFSVSKNQQVATLHANTESDERTHYPTALLCSFFLLSYRQKRLAALTDDTNFSASLRRET